MAVVFVAVGEHRADPDRLLLLGEDGRFYAHALPDGTTTPVEPSEDWVIDEHAPAAHGIAGTTPSLTAASSRATARASASPSLAPRPR